MKLKEILSQIKIAKIAISDNSILERLSIEDVAIDSRLVKENSAFFALIGESKNGLEFVFDAVKNGAKLIVATDFIDDLPQDILIIKVENPFLFLVEFLKIFYPNLPKNIYAVTGTNGKTSVAEFSRQILHFVGKKSASIGTLGVICDEIDVSKLQNSSLTTPDIISLFKNLSYLKQNGIDDVVMETSSIGLRQGRLNGLKIDVGAFTNFSQDHIDYHKTMSEYFDCKMILFEDVLTNNSTAILNSDIKEFLKIKEICQKKGHKIIEYGKNSNDIKLKNITKISTGQIVNFEFLGNDYQFNLLADGDFQVYNALCAVGIILAKNPLNKDNLQNLLQNFTKITPALGRMQNVATLPNKAQVFIDFAHTPDALENVLKLARKLTKSRVIVLFGCGGNRDAKKRPIMGEIACRLADFVIVTDDNPRKEDAKNIRAEIILGCDKNKIIEISGRENAIEKSIQMLKDGDILILAGKGHEKYQIIGDVKNDFDEELIVKNALKK